MVNFLILCVEFVLLFLYCVVDCFGLWYVKEGRREVKRYGILFICMVSCVIYIEVVYFMEIDLFL